jgi:hypothetical protein
MTSCIKYGRSALAQLGLPFRHGRFHGLSRSRFVRLPSGIAASRPKRKKPEPLFRCYGPHQSSPGESAMAEDSVSGAPAVTELRVVLNQTAGSCVH